MQFEGSVSAKVSFLVAGVQKGGTTALFDYLNEHPNLRLPAIKEAHFFDDETGVDWSSPDYGAYHALFSAEEGGGPKLLGEATPIYIYWPRSLERIVDYNPAMRMILIFRDPIERAWSHWKMEYARGAETRPFAWCIREGRVRVAEDADTPGYHRVHSYVERGLYGAQVERLLTLFPREQVLFLRSDELRTDPARILCNVCDFLHAPRFVQITPKESHLSKDIDYGPAISAEDRRHLRSLFAQDQLLFSNMTGISFPHFE